MKDVAASLQTVRVWVPVAVPANGTVWVQPLVLAVPELTWGKGRLRAIVERPGEGRGAAIVSADIGSAPPLRLKLEAESLGLQLETILSSDATGLRLLSTSLWLSNRIDVAARFGSNCQLPERASVRTPQVQIAAKELGLKGYGNITGMASANWKEGAFTVDISAAARSQFTRSNLPPLKADLHARGDTEPATIQTAAICSPWLRAELTRDLRLYFRGQLLREPAGLKLAGDPRRQPWFALRGEIKGEADFRPTTGKFPECRFEFSGRDIGNAVVATRTLAVLGSLEWP